MTTPPKSALQTAVLWLAAVWLSLDLWDRLSGPDAGRVLAVMAVVAAVGLVYGVLTGLARLIGGRRRAD